MKSVAISLPNPSKSLSNGIDGVDLLVYTPNSLICRGLFQCILYISGDITASFTLYVKNF
jgi:hypothetical protein